MSTESWVINAPQTVDVADVRRVVVQLTDGAVDVVTLTGTCAPPRASSARRRTCP